MTTSRLVVIGGSAAGAKAAAKARRLDQKAEITIIQKEPDLSMASCGYPYYLGGSFNERDKLLATPTGVVRDPEFFRKTKDVNALVETECTAIDRERRQVRCRDFKSGEIFTIGYDRLVIATGARAKPMPVPGADLAGVTTLLNMADTDFIHDAAASGRIRRAVVIGGGLIGVEACEALVSRGIEVTLVELDMQILSMLDSQLAMLVANHMESKNVQVRTFCGLEAFRGNGDTLTGVELTDGTMLDCDLAIVATGVQPNSELARDAGLTVGKLGGIAVNEWMQTSDESIYAAGDCVETTHLLTGDKVLAPMGDLANLQGRVAGENAIMGNDARFPGTVRTAICKIFDFTAGVTGLTEKEAESLSIAGVETVVNASPDKPGFMGGGLLISKLLVSRGNGQILGFQCVGNGDVSRQMAAAAMAIQGKLTVDDLAVADLPYAPPYSLAIDHCIATAHLMQNKLTKRLKTISAEELQSRLVAQDLPFLVDVRGPDEYELLRLGIGEKYIPLGMLRNKLAELPGDTNEEIVCFCKISLRGYEAALILEANGWTNVKVLEGGIMAWPYDRGL